MSSLAATTAEPPPPPAGAQSFVSQPQSRLLSMPKELRMIIYDYITLTPSSPDFPHWRGAYFTCRQLRSELRDAVRPLAALDELRDITCLCCEEVDNLTITPGPSFSEFDLLDDVVVHLHMNNLTDHFMFRTCEAFERLYSLFLRRLHVIVLGEATYRTGVGPANNTMGMLPWGDLKSMHMKILARFVTWGKVNCTAVTFTIQSLADAEGGRETTTTIENTFEDSGVPYQLTIVQDKNGGQSERTFSSATRFKKVELAQSSEVMVLDT